MSRHHTHLNARRWAAIRRAVFERDGWRCVMCGKAGRLECDHITPLEREPGQDVYDPPDLQSLCRDCHISKTAKENRRELTPDEQAWRAMVTEILHSSRPACASHLSHPGCIKNADRSAGTGDGTIFAVRRA